MRDALRSYLQIATGLTEMTVQRVTEAAKQLVEKTGVDLDGVPAQVAQQAQTVPGYVQQIADDLFTTGKANRDLLVGVVRGEVEKAMARLRPWADDVRRVEDEVARLEHRVTDLEHRLAQASAPRRPARPQPVVVDVADEEPVPVRSSGARATKVAEPEAQPFARRPVTPARTARKAAAKKAAAQQPVAKPVKSAAKKTAAARTAKSAETKAPAKKAAVKAVKKAPPKSGEKPAEASGKDGEA